jgi:hypothetical protein
MTEIRESMPPPIIPPHPGAHHDLFSGISTTGEVVLVLFVLVWIVGLAACFSGISAGILFLYRRFSRDWKHSNWKKESEKHPVISGLMAEEGTILYRDRDSQGYRYSLSTRISPGFKTLDELERCLSSSPETIAGIGKCQGDLKELLSGKTCLRDGRPVYVQPPSGEEEALPTPV